MKPLVTSLVIALLKVNAVWAQGSDPVGEEFQVNSYTTNYQERPSVAADAQGNFVVVWDSYDESQSYYTSYLSVRGQRYSATGAPLGSDFQIDSYTTATQWVPAVAADAQGNFIVVWESQGSFGTDDFGQSIQGQRYV